TRVHKDREQVAPQVNVLQSLPEAHRLHTTDDHEVLAKWRTIRRAAAVVDADGPPHRSEERRVGTDGSALVAAGRGKVETGNRLLATGNQQLPTRNLQPVTTHA